MVSRRVAPGVEKAREDEVPASAEIAAMLTALGTGGRVAAYSTFSSCAPTSS